MQCSVLSVIYNPVRTIILLFIDGKCMISSSHPWAFNFVLSFLVRKPFIQKTKCAPFLFSIKTEFLLTSKRREKKDSASLSVLPVCAVFLKDMLALCIPCLFPFICLF